jgi:tRNA pseudouridine38-40 synthase
MLIFRYFVQLSYDGSDYCGWQIQPNGKSVQKILTDVFSMKLHEEVTITGAGRTDAGVHAINYIAHFDTTRKIDTRFIEQVNRFLPNDIVIHTIKPVIPEAHARFSALSRTYEYRITREKNPFINRYSLYYKGDLDIERMNNAAEILLHEKDFTSFSKLHSDNKTNDCHVMYARWLEQDNMLVFTICADRFLRNMVRAVTGTLLDVGKGKLDMAGFKHVLNSRNRQAASTSAPAKALFLVNVDYPKNIYII